MPIKVGFSTSVCPGWDLAHIAEQADTLGFYGVELGPHSGAAHLPDSPEFDTEDKITAIRAMFAERHVEIAGLTTRWAVDARDQRRRTQAREKIAQAIELAAKLGAATVRMPLGTPHGGESMEAALPRQYPDLRALADDAAHHQVTLLLHNTAGFPDSRALWTAIDAVAHPRLRCSWNPVLGMGAGEHSTISIPRLGARLRMVQAADATFDDAGRFLGFSPVGKGAVDWERSVDLLKGVLFDGYLMLDWPAQKIEALADPQKTLPAASVHLLDRIRNQDPKLSAYEKDKKVPNWSKAAASYVQRPSKGENAVAETDAPAET
jgi:sugar phosphate isomerase/epimerase/ribosomal protein S30